MTGPRAGAPPTTTGLRWLAAPAPVIEPATDLGGVSVLKHGNLYLLSDGFGDIHPDGRGLGLYDLDTRVLSCAVLRMNGARPTLLRSQTSANHEGTIQLTNPEYLKNRDDKIVEEVARQSLSMLRHRWIGDGFAEQITVTNFSPVDQAIAVDLELDMDAADIFEVRGLARRTRGRFLDTAATDRTLVFSYVGLDSLVRRSYLVFTPGEVSARNERPAAEDAPGHGGEGSVRLRWTATIQAGASTEFEWRLWTDLRPIGPSPSASAPVLEGAPGATVPLTAASRDADHGRGEVDREHRDQVGTHPVHSMTPQTAPVTPPQHAAVSYEAWSEHAAQVDSDGELLDLAIHRSIADLRLLMNDGPRAGDHYVAAGVPWFTTLFGRDAIITALESLPFMPELAVDTLRVLAGWQATDHDPSRDMAPGKILHELRTGELMRTGEIPHRPYYGSVDATPLWLVLLGETVRWTGNLALVRELWPNVLAALGWINGDGDLDGDGFVEYHRGQPGTLFNQGWKDSGDSIRHRDGSIAQAPIALVEVQGYVYDAKIRIAELARLIDETELAEGLETSAADLRRRFDDAFWMEDVGFYAVALDGEKRQVGSIDLKPRPLPLERHRARTSGRPDQRAPAQPGPRFRAGACGPTPRDSRGSTRSATTPAASGRMTTRSPPPGSSRLDAMSTRAGSRRGSSRRRDTPPNSGCRSCSAASIGTPRPCRSRIRWRAPRRPGRRQRRCRCWRPCSACSPGLPRACWCSISRTSPRGSAG